MTVTLDDGRKRVVIEGISPEIDGGRFPAKRTVGDQVRVEADIFTDGHDSISASLLAHREGSDEWTEIPMHSLVNDRWTASFRVGELGRYGFKVQGWVDHFETWRRDLLIVRHGTVDLRTTKLEWYQMFKIINPREEYHRKDRGYVDYFRV